MMPNKHNKQKIESQIYTFGLATHYQLQKNFSKIELNLRQGCQLFTVYIFGSFCWLYLIRYSNKTNEPAYSKVDFLVQDILFETLPLLSEKGIICGETNDNYNLTDKETINYFENQKIKPTKCLATITNKKFVNIELTPFFSEKLQNYIGRKPFKSRGLLNSTWKNFELLQKKNQPNPGDSHLASSSKTYVPLSRKQPSKAILSAIPSLALGHSEEAIGGFSCFASLASLEASYAGDQKELIFFARKPVFIKVKTKSSTFPGIPTPYFSFTTKTSEQQNLAKQILINRVSSSSSVKEAHQISALLTVPTPGQVGERKVNFMPLGHQQTNINVFLKKQILTQKKAYNLSGTSLIMDSEIDFLPRKLEECVSFSKIGSYATLPKEVKVRLRHYKTDFSVNFKPHLTLTENLFWCKTLIKTKTEICSRWFSFARVSAIPSAMRGVVLSRAKLNLEVKINPKNQEKSQEKQNGLLGPCVLTSSKHSYKNKTKNKEILLNFRGFKNVKIAKTWFNSNSFESNYLPLPLSFTKKKAEEGVVLVARLKVLAKHKKHHASFAFDASQETEEAKHAKQAMLYKKNQNQPKKIKKNFLSTANIKSSNKVTEELLLQNFFIKKKGSWKSKGQFIDIFNQPRLQSGFYFPNAPIIKKNKEKLKGGLGLTINPCIARLFFLRKSTILEPVVSFANSTQSIDCTSKLSDANQRENTKPSAKLTPNCEVLDAVLHLKTPPFLPEGNQAVGASVPFTQKQGPLGQQEAACLNYNPEKDYFHKNIFLEWLYEPRPKSEYLSYSRANTKFINLQKKAAQFVLLDRHTDLKTSDCFYEKRLSSHNTEKTFVEKIFSYKRNSFSGLLDAPENFSGTPYLKLGERFTIEKLKSKNKMGTLYSIHSSDVWASSKQPTVLALESKQCKPYASMGTSLKTVFGKKQFTVSQNQNSKKVSKVQNLITNARLVTSWSKEPLVLKNLCKSWSSIELKDNNLLFSSQEKKQLAVSSIQHTMHKTTSNASDVHLPSIRGNKYFATNTVLNKDSKAFCLSPRGKEGTKISNIFYFKRISGKANRNITLPFKYYNPGIKRERNVEDTMLILEGYKKSRLFPTIHNDYRGIATRGLPIAIEIDKVVYTDQDIDLQSILGGMRQRTEKQRIAENLSQPSVSNVEHYEQELVSFTSGTQEGDMGAVQTKHSKQVPFGQYSENLTNSQEKSQEKEYSIKKKRSFAGKYNSQNKKRRLSNYYPLCTSLAVCPQEALPQKALGTTNIVDYNFMDSFTAKTLKFQTKELKGSIQTKGFYFEKLLCSGQEKFPFLYFLGKNWLPISPSFLAKILFFTCTWYSYKILATPLSQSTQFLPATFTEAIGLQSFQQKYRIIKGKNSKLGFSFKNLAGAEKTLSELRDLIWTFRLIGTGSPNHKHNLFTLFPYIGSRFGQSRRSVFSKSRNRLLLAGPPGTGKTLLVKALAAEANLPVIVQPVSSLRMISGVENPVSALFHVARQIKPCIIFLDELDTLGNDYDVSTNNYTAEQKLGIRLARKYTYTLLLELDGLTSSTRDLLIIGATNRLETLNPALTRAGRFDTILDFNLPSQEVRTALFSFYLGTEQTLQQSKEKNKTTKKKNPLTLTRQNKKETYLKKINFKFKQPNKRPCPTSTGTSFWLESYLAAKCIGLSHASIGTIINESALESMLMVAQTKQKPRNMLGSLSKPLHTLETLERAINSVKTLTSRMVQTDNTLCLSSSIVLGLRSLPSKQGSFLPKEKNKKNKFQAEFLVNKIYQIVGSLIFQKKSQEKNNRNSFSVKTKKPFYKVSWPSCPTGMAQLTSTPKHMLTNHNSLKGLQSTYLQGTNRNGKVHNVSSCPRQPLLTIKSPLTFNQKEMPINRKDLQNVLLQEYSGVASVSIYTAAKPLTFKILARAGLYQDPNYVAATLLTLRILTLQSSFYRECGTKGNFSGQVSNQNLLVNDKLAERDKTSKAMPITKDNFTKISSFVSESNLAKVFFSDTKNLAGLWGQPFYACNAKQAEQAGGLLSHQSQKSVLFWKNGKEKTKKNTFLSSFARDSASFTKQSKQASETLLMDVKAANGLTTNWFRVYFSRPFFRYDTFHYIENKEYYPKNNFLLKRNTLFQRNVSTLSHTTSSRLCLVGEENTASTATMCLATLASNSNLNHSILAFPKKKKKEIGFDVLDPRSFLFKKQISFLTTDTTEKKGKLWSNKQEKYSSLLIPTVQTVPCKSSVTGPFPCTDKELPVTRLNPTFVYETKESLYLAIVASIFHKGIQFFQKNRELTDYCTYTFLRYGVLYEFYLEAICQKF